MKNNFIPEETEVVSLELEQNLFSKFIDPLFFYVWSIEQQSAALNLAKMLWLSIILGPEMEERTFELIGKDFGLPEEEREMVRIFYYSKMKPILSPDELWSLRLNYLPKIELAQGEGKVFELFDHLTCDAPKYLV